VCSILSSVLPSIGQEKFVRAMVGFSQGMVSKVLNPRALGLGQSLTKAVSPRDRETSSFFSSLVRSLVVFLEFQYSVSEQFQYLSPADFRCLRETSQDRNCLYVPLCSCSWSEIPRETDLYSGSFGTLWSSAWYTSEKYTRYTVVSSCTLW